MGFINRMDQNVVEYWYTNEKMVVVPACLNGKCCSSEYLPLLTFRRRVVNEIFLKYSKEGRLCSSHLGIRNIPSDCNGTRTHNHLIRKRTLNHLAELASLAKWLSVRLRIKWLWVRVPLQSVKLQISRLFRARSSLTFRQL